MTTPPDFQLKFFQQLFSVCRPLSVCLRLSVWYFLSVCSFYLLFHSRFFFLGLLFFYPSFSPLHKSYFPKKSPALNLFALKSNIAWAITFLKHPVFVYKENKDFEFFPITRKKSRGSDVQFFFQGQRHLKISFKNSYFLLVFFFCFRPKFNFLWSLFFFLFLKILFITTWH